MAVSAILLENPHSLSYQARIRAIPLGKTLVSLDAKVDDAGQWLKSIETRDRSSKPKIPFRFPSAASFIASLI